MQRIQGLYVMETVGRGRGVFTALPISQGDLIEICPVIVLPSFEKPIIHKTNLHDYYFLWGKKLDQCAIALGFGSMYNHAEKPNASFLLDMINESIDITCIQPINPGEEITINYHGDEGTSDDLWFDIVK